MLVLTDAGADLNPRRMERHFALIGRSGARAVVLVNKADLFPAAQTQEAVEGDPRPASEVVKSTSAAWKAQGLAAPRPAQKARHWRSSARVAGKSAL